MYTEYDQEIIDILQDMSFVNDQFDETLTSYPRMPGPSQSSAAAVSRKSTSSVTKGFGATSGRAQGGRSRSLYFSAADLK
jgi:hypothetical protein